MEALKKTGDDFAGGMAEITRSGPGGKQAGVIATITPNADGQGNSVAQNSIPAPSQERDQPQEEAEGELQLEDLLALLDQDLIAEMEFDESWLESLPEGLYSYRGRRGGARVLMAVQLLILLQQQQIGAQQNINLQQTILLRQLQAVQMQLQQAMSLPPEIQAKRIEQILQAPQLRETIAAVKDNLLKNAALPEKASFPQLAQLTAARVVDHAQPALANLAAQIRARIENGPISPSVEKSIKPTLILLQQILQPQARPAGPTPAAQVLQQLKQLSLMQRSFRQLTSNPALPAPVRQSIVQFIAAIPKTLTAPSFTPQVKADIATQLVRVEATAQKQLALPNALVQQAALRQTLQVIADYKLTAVPSRQNTVQPAPLIVSAASSIVRLVDVQKHVERQSQASSISPSLRGALQDTANRLQTVVAPVRTSLVLETSRPNDSILNVPASIKAPVYETTPILKIQPEASSNSSARRTIPSATTQHSIQSPPLTVREMPARSASPEPVARIVPPNPRAITTGSPAERPPIQSPPSVTPVLIREAALPKADLKLTIEKPAAPLSPPTPPVETKIFETKPVAEPKPIEIKTQPQAKPALEKPPASEIPKPQPEPATENSVSTPLKTATIPQAVPTEQARSAGVSTGGLRAARQRAVANVALQSRGTPSADAGVTQQDVADCCKQDEHQTTAAVAAQAAQNILQNNR